MNTIYGKGTLEAPYTPIATLNGGGGGGTPYELPQATSSILGGVKANTVQQNGAATIDVLQNNGLLTLKAAGAGAAGGGSATNFGAVKGAAFESGQSYVNAAVVNGEVKTYTPIATQNTLGGVKASPKSSDMTQAVGIDSVGKLWVKGGGGGTQIALELKDDRTYYMITAHYMIHQTPSMGGDRVNPQARILLDTLYPPMRKTIEYILPNYTNINFYGNTPDGKKFMIDFEPNANGLYIDMYIKNLETVEGQFFDKNFQFFATDTP